MAASNLAVYNDQSILALERRLPHAHGWLDTSERVAVSLVADSLRGGRILDIGVGTGRTTELLTLLSQQYVGIDFAESRIELCRRRLPGVDLRVGDVRTLSSFGDESFDLVFFSFNGIDYIDHDERRGALGEIHRVLAPEGYFIFSTLNKDGPSFGERPWQLHRPGETLRVTPDKFLRLTYLTLTDPMRLWRRVRNFNRNGSRSLDGPEWGIRPLATLDFSLMQHFVTLRGLRDELANGGFNMISIMESEYESYPSEAVTIAPETDASGAGGFQVVARRQS